MKKETQIIVHDYVACTEITYTTKSMVVISDDYTTYRFAVNEKGQISVTKVTANGVDTIVIQPETGNRILIF